MALDPLNFAYWLHGFDEISNGKVPDATQWQIIKDHLKLVVEPKVPQISGSVGVSFRLPNLNLPHGVMC